MILLAGVLAATLLTPPPAQAVEVVVDPAELGRGAVPGLPVLDRESLTIRDGSRSVSLRDLVGNPEWFLKVDGGYLLDRGRNDVVMVRNDGRRRVLTGRRTSDYGGAPAVAVSRDGAKVALSISDPNSDGSATYRETRVLDIASGKVLARRVLPTSVGRVPLAFGTGRVLLGGGWWSFRTNQVERFDRSIRSAHLPSWRAVGRHPGAAGAVSAFDLPPDDGPPVVIAPGGGRRTWSLDGSRLAGPGETSETSGATDRIVVHDARDGSVDLSVGVSQAAPVVTWESPSTVLFVARSRSEGQDALVRCTLAGVCERAGPLESNDVEGPTTSSYALLVVTRREG